MTRSSNEINLQKDVEALVMQTQRLKTLNAFAQSLITIPNVEELLWHVAREVVAHLGFEDCVIYRTDLEPDALVQVAAIGSKNPDQNTISNQLTIAMGEGITGAVAQSGQALIVNDLANDPRYIQDLDVAGSEICVPLVVDGVVVGVIDSEAPQVGAFNDGHLEMLSSVAVMTSSKIAECRNIERVRLQSEVLQRISEFVIILDPTGKISAFNNAFSNLFSTSAEDLMHVNAFEIYSNFVDQADLGPVDGLGAILHNTPWEGDITADTKDGERTFRLSVNPMPKRPGKRDEFVVLGRDVTAERLAKRSLQERNTVLQNMSLELTDALEQAKIAQQTQAVFLANVSHELRTPLNAIVGFSDIMQTDGFIETQAQKAREYNQYIHSAGNHLTSLVNDLLDISSLNAKEASVHTVSFAPGPQIAHCLKLLGSKAEAKGIELRFEDDSGDQLIGFDERHFSQVLTNLIDNAIKYSPRDSLVVVRAFPTETGLVAISIADAGEGIPPSQIDSIFTPFSRANWECSQDVEGAGLGLALVSKLVEANAAQITVESEVGTGSTFTLYAPLHDQVSADQADDPFLQAGSF